MNRLHARYYNARNAFYVFEALEKARSPRHAGKCKVHKNIGIINDYINFFAPVKEAVRVYFFLELAKFFDPDRRTNSIWNLVYKIDRQIKYLSREDFFKYKEEQGAPVMEVLKEKYRPISKKDLVYIRRSLKSIKSIIDKLKVYRDQNIAHDDAIKEDHPINRIEINRTFSIIESILNKLSLRLEFSTWYYRNVRRESERHTRMVIDALIYKKKKRMEEFDEKFKLRKIRK